MSDLERQLRERDERIEKLERALHGMCQRCARAEVAKEQAEMVLAGLTAELTALRSHAENSADGETPRTVH